MVAAGVSAAGVYVDTGAGNDSVTIGAGFDNALTVTIGAGGTVGGGSTITKDTPAGALSVARGKQLSVANWSRPKKQAK